VRAHRPPRVNERCVLYSEPPFSSETHYGTGTNRRLQVPARISKNSAFHQSRNRRALVQVVPCTEVGQALIGKPAHARARWKARMTPWYVLSPIHVTSVACLSRAPLVSMHDSSATTNPPSRLAELPSRGLKTRSSCRAQRWRRTAR
jgi:hypothetical protein